METARRFERAHPNGLRGVSRGAGFLIAVASWAAAVPEEAVMTLVQPGFVVPLPPAAVAAIRGASRSCSPPCSAAAKAEPPQTRAAPQITSRQGRAEKGVPELDAKKSRKPPPRRPRRPRPRAAARGALARRQSSQTPGGSSSASLPGPALPRGTDPMGDWYSRRSGQIRMLWTQQIRGEQSQPGGVHVRFTITRALGSVEDVEIIQSSGAIFLDNAAQRVRTHATWRPFSSPPTQDL
jgi:TonB family protein